MKKIVLIIIAAGLMTISSYSQEDVLRPKGRVDDGAVTKTGKHPWAIGLEGGLSYNKYNTDLSWFDANNNQTNYLEINDVVKSLDGLSPHLGIFVDYSFNETFGINLKLIYNAVKYSGSKTTPFDFYDFNTSPPDFLGTENVTYDYDENYSFINIEPHLRINATKDLYFLVGPSIQLAAGDLVFNNKYTKEGTAFTFVNNTNEMNEKLTGTNKSRVALNLGAGYKFNVSKNISVAPQLIYSKGLSNLESLDASLEMEKNNKITRILSNRNLDQIRFSVTLWFENL